MKLIPCILLSLLCLSSCKEKENIKASEAKTTTNYDLPPKWAQDVIWYEIAVERFYNGDPSNDQTAADIVDTYPGFVPEGWDTTPWTQDWYEDDAYFENLHPHKDYYGNTLKDFGSKAQLRRYGGDLQGVLDKMDYIDSLGVTAIYFRPLNDAPSLHKYDARNWRHIDRNFGPDPTKDKATIEAETPDDPSTWQWTEADKLFLKVIYEFHKRDIRVILDYSWNHTGKSFWAWQDVLKNQENSKYKDWFWIDHFDNQATEDNEFKYHGWAGVHELPEIKETQKQDLSKSVQKFEGDIYSKAVKQHIFNLTKRWLDPNGDGNPSDGIDGYRLDVAAETPLGFWRDFRKHVRGINPDAYLLGEIWWEEWPDKLLDPEPFLQGDIFDGVMNYRWYRTSRQFLNAAPTEISASNLIDSLHLFRSNIREENNYAMMNLNGGFDTPRVLTSFFNQNQYKYYCKVSEDPNYKIHKPDESTHQRVRLLLAHQYTYIGAPHIWAGDEMGMWGADDPSTRKPLLWPEFTFDDEKVHPLGMEKPIDKVAFNKDLFAYYQKLIHIRKGNPVLSRGDIEFLNVDSEKVLAYSRYDDEHEIITIINSGDIAVKVNVPTRFSGTYKNLLNPSDFNPNNKVIELEISANTAIILKF
ncbi:alpha-amylase family glycosyl hydrolase [Seonamhaeicola sp.]|uniref:alpha-amylase family glycosyl hydrolase n=1 Tax=Seonamhaeicola sp. TaxID=1912245 RepID=UPI0026062877|nr:alpha-amylase family glycosyl hydrolase [Seonamhaeicola sp.]